jgi:tol-pal system protein YbgF
VADDRRGEIRGVRKGFAWLTLAAALAGMTGCHDHSAVERQLADLRKELEQIKAVGSSASVVLEDMENRILLLQDQVDSTRLLLGSSGGPLPPALPVVRLVQGPGSSPPPGDLVTDPGDAGLAPGGDAPSATDPVPAAGPDPGRPIAIEYQELDEFGNVVGQRSGRHEGPPPSEAPEGPGRKTFDSRPLMLYKQGMDLLNAKRHREAVAIFEDFLVQYPGHDYADNCLYWIGEAYYDRQMFQPALARFEQVIVQYPRGNKVPDALLKAAFCYRELGMKDRARDLFEKLIRTWPDSPAARLAEKGRESLL